MTPRQVELVRTTRNTVVPIPDQAAALFYGGRHVGYGFKDAHYDTVGAALLWTLEKGLGDQFTPEVKEAWTTTYTILATTMKNAAKSVPA